MPISVKCPTCENTLMADETLIGKQARCPMCASVIAVAESVALNAASLKAEAAKPEIMATLNKNRDLAREIGIRGTPASPSTSRPSRPPSTRWCPRHGSAPESPIPASTPPHWRRSASPPPTCSSSAIPGDRTSPVRYAFQGSAGRSPGAGRGPRACRT